MKSALKTVKGIGAESGAHHWWMQRITAIALIPLFIWFVSAIFCVTSKDKGFDAFFGREVCLILFATMLFTMLYHSVLGVKVVIEDYVSCSCMRSFLIVSVNLFAALTGVFLFFVVISKFTAI